MKKLFLYITFLAVQMISFAQDFWILDSAFIVNKAIHSVTAFEYRFNNKGDIRDSALYFYKTFNSHGQIVKDIFRADMFISHPPNNYSGYSQILYDYNSDNTISRKTTSFPNCCLQSIRIDKKKHFKYNRDILDKLMSCDWQTFQIDSYQYNSLRKLILHKETSDNDTVITKYFYNNSSKLIRENTFNTRQSEILESFKYDSLNKWNSDENIDNSISFTSFRNVILSTEINYVYDSSGLIVSINKFHIYKDSIFLLENIRILRFIVGNRLYEERELINNYQNYNSYEVIKTYDSDGKLLHDNQFNYFYGCGKIIERNSYLNYIGFEREVFKYDSNEFLYEVNAYLNNKLYRIERYYYN